MAATSKPTTPKSGALTVDDAVDLILRAAEKDDRERLAALVERIAEEGVASSTGEAASKEGKANKQKAQEVPADVIPPDEFNAMTKDELVSLMERDMALYKRSLKAAAAAAA